ncbi:MAG: iron-sulfur cluster repair di-iron protein [Ekhidna sp.]
MVFQKTIREIVDENYVYARALHYLGIEFFEQPDRKLKEICEERQLDQKMVIKSFYTFDTCHRFSFRELETYPIELLTEYLKHSHHVFIKDKLPYIVHLTKHLQGNDAIQGLLPEFVEDLIRHIYEEEDSTFRYIQLLTKIEKGKEKAPFSQLMKYEHFSLEGEFVHHKEEDELEAIRSLLSSVDESNLHNRVLIKEIKAFDREMIYHAEIENNIFFPKAIELERKVKSQLRSLSQLN